MAQKLFHEENETVWIEILQQYEVVLQQKSKLPKKHELLKLDNWYQNDLPILIASRSPKHLTKDELVKLMKWKLMRGKFRPRLTELVQQNTAQDVKDISEESFKLAKDVQKSIKEMSRLKAVGPATASAILTASNPKIYPFMADEAMVSVPGLRIDYTVGTYTKFQSLIKQKANKLNKDNKSSHWTPHKVELALWTKATADKLGMDLDVKMESTISKKRKREDEAEIDTGERRKKVGTKKQKSDF